MTEEEKKELIREAFKARHNSYSPYSHFAVGAALKTKEGKIYTGSNMENAAFGPGVCAERCAFACAVKEGEREFAAIAVVGGKAEEKEEVSDFAYPCGVCRQVMREFADPDEFVIIVAKSETEAESHTLSELLPYGFGKENM